MDHQHPEHHQHVALAVFATAAVTAIIVGVLVFNFQEKRFTERQANTKDQLAQAGEVVKDLQTEKKAVEQEATDAKQQVKEVSSALKEISVEKSKAMERIKLPLVRYTREGLLSKEERALIEEKLVGPYVSFYDLEESEDPVITMEIEIPEKKGAGYVVRAIHEITTTQFLFEKKTGTIEFWKPDCMDGCEYPKTFIKKYPQLMEKE